VAAFHSVAFGISVGDLVRWACGEGGIVMVSAKRLRKVKGDDTPMRVVTTRYLFLKMPSKMLSLLSSLLHLTELKIRAKTKVWITSPRK